MISSIILLLILQFFWLRNSYRDAANNFRQETNSIFRNTIFAMHDSLIQRSIEPVMRDSVRHIFKRQQRSAQDSLQLGFHLEDTFINHIDVRERAARVEVYMSDNHDSIFKILNPVVKRIQNERQPKSFIIRLGPDSLKIDSIAYFFKRDLDKAGINTPFKVMVIKRLPGERGQRGERGRGRLFKQPSENYFSDIVPFNPMFHYAVSFSSVGALLLKEIAPQILFSIFLTLLTIVSFCLMYSNLRAQQRLMEMKNEFISNVTHELKTPVATVSVALEALKNFRALDNPQRTSEYLDIAQNELNRLTLMTDKILKTAVFENQGIDLKIEKIDVDQMLQQILLSMKLVFEKRKTKISYEKEGTDFGLSGSHTHLTNVMYNLLDNALKYSDDGASIKVILTDLNHSLTIAVQDTGVGIPVHYQKKIFEKFFRVPTGDLHNIKGYGLGLSYVASVIRSHHGEISVDSEPGKGSCFTITLPKMHEN
ncbi:MAG: sensor histidine kinase [Bacteroidota bacterium]